MIAGANIRAVTFDVGGTLIEPFLSIGQIYSEVAARHGVQVPAEVLNERFTAAWKAKENFGHSLNEWSNLVDATFAGLTHLRPSKTFFPELYEEFATRRAWRIFEDSIPCLERLQQMGKRLAVISNWDERLRPLLDQLNLSRFFEVIVVSIEVGVPKPDEKIFKTAAARLNVDPTHILHVGDSPREDVTGARQAGFTGILIRRNQARVANEQIQSLLELGDLV
jgi:putative hydrolase of the HAD superfamily